MNFEQDNTFLIYGKSGAGKSTSLETLDLTKVSFINVEAKPPSFKGAKKLKKYFRTKDLNEFKKAIKESIEDDGIELVVVDSITMLADKLMFKEFIENAPLSKDGSKNTRSGWMDYKTWFNNMIHYCKTSNKSFIFIALAMEINSEEDAFEKSIVPKIQGSLKESLSSEFTTVIYARTKLHETEDGKKYGEHLFQTNKAPDNWFCEAKSPRGMFEDIYIPNDAQKVLDAIKEYYQ